LDPQQQTISTLNEVQIESLTAEGVIVGGMVNKVRAALDAAKHSRQAVTIASWQSLTIERLLREQQANDTTIITME
jgi:acetylglutamate kinase